MKVKVTMTVTVTVKGVALVVIWNVKVDTRMQDFMAANIAMCQSLKGLLLCQDPVGDTGRLLVERNKNMLPLRGAAEKPSLRGAWDHR